MSGCLYSEALAVPLVDDPLSVHRRRAADRNNDNIIMIIFTFEDAVLDFTLSSLCRELVGDTPRRSEETVNKKVRLHQLLMSVSLLSLIITTFAITLTCEDKLICCRVCDQHPLTLEAAELNLVQGVDRDVLVQRLTSRPAGLVVRRPCRGRDARGSLPGRAIPVF